MSHWNISTSPLSGYFYKLAKIQVKENSVRDIGSPTDQDPLKESWNKIRNLWTESFAPLPVLALTVKEIKNITYTMSGIGRIGGGKIFIWTFW